MYAEYEKRLEADLFLALKQNPARDLSTISLRPANVPSVNPIFNEDEVEDEEEEGDEEESEEAQEN